MQSAAYRTRRSELQTYFDRTAVDAWARLTSDAPVSGVRAKVRAGRDAMRATLLGFLPDDLTGARLLDAGCGTGALAVAAAARGADVTAVDVAPTLVQLAQDRSGDRSVGGETGGRIAFEAGCMLDPAFGTFDHIVAMDSLIHYEREDILAALAGLAARARRSVVFTVAPRTPLLATLRAVGKLFPRGDRSPRIAPASISGLMQAFATDQRFSGWRLGRSVQISRAFYISHALELVRT